MLGVGVPGWGKATPIRAAAVEGGPSPEAGGVGGPGLGYSKDRVLTLAHREPRLSFDDDLSLLCGVAVVMVVSSEVRTTGATAAALMLLKAAAPEKGEVKAA